MSSSLDIHTGPWINHSHGNIIGATLTLTTRDAAFLLAFLAIIVTAAGNSFWIIASYAVHQFRSEREPHDTIFYQQQAVLKNSSTALDAVWKLASVSFAWRKHNRNRWWHSRTLYLIALAVGIAAVFAVASIFSSQVTKSANSEVLVDSSGCGFWEFPTNATNAGVHNYDLKTINESAQTQAYTDKCYRTGHQDPSCGTFQVPEIIWTTTQNASCPFIDGTCLTPSFQMDTGFLDSHSILGINAKESQRVSVRKLATCAPLHMAPYGVIVNQTFGPYEDEWAQVYAGPILDVSNYTYEYNRHTVVTGAGYALSAFTSGSQTWMPIPAFNRTDADVSLYFFNANDVSYSYPNSDPIFGASENFTINVEGINVTSYASDLPITTLGCVDQYQICNPNLRNEQVCTRLSNLNDLFDLAERIEINLYQAATIETIILSMIASSMFKAVYGHDASILKASKTVFDGSQIAELPNNQWQSELLNWFGISLASLQQYLLEKAAGPTGIVEAGGYIQHPTNKYEEAICKRQMVRNVSGYQNFSTLGVLIILVVGVSLVGLGLGIDTAVGWLQQRVGKHFERLTWISDGYLQLQRMAYESEGYDDWEGCTDEVPISNTEEKEVQQLGGLDDWDIKHPRLIKAPGTAEDAEFKSPSSPNEDTQNYSGLGQKTVGHDEGDGMHIEEVPSNHDEI